MTRPSSRFRSSTIPFALVVAAVLLITALAGLGATSASSPGVRAATARSDPPAPSPTTELADARASLSRGAGPAAPHPGISVGSPDSYTWANLSTDLASAPSGRLATLAWDGSDGYVLLFGWGSVTGALNDTWTFSNGTWTNVTDLVGHAPPASSYDQMAFDPSSGKVVLWETIQNETWTYRDHVWTNITATSGGHPPDTFEDDQMATDTSDNEVVYLYSFAQNGYTWVFKDGTWSNVSVTAAFNFGRIYAPTLSDDPPDHGVLAFVLSAWKNTTPELYYPATLLFSAGAWTNLTPTVGAEPLTTVDASAAFVPGLTAVVLVSSLSLTSNGTEVLAASTWEFSHRTWLNVTDTTGTAPDNGVLAGVAADPSTDSLVLFGGEHLTHAPVFWPATWLFSGPPSASGSASATVVDAGQPVTFTGTASVGAPPGTTRWTFGDGTNASGTVVGHTYSAAGPILATFSVTDELGRVATATVDLVVNPALSVSANATPSTASVATWVTLAATISGGTGPYSVNWTLGDGTVSTLPALGHEYATAGNYSVRVTVKDARGETATKSFSLVVLPLVTTNPQPASSGTTLTSGLGLGLLGFVVLLLVVVVVLAVLLARKPKSPPGPPTAFAGTPPATSAPPSGPPSSGPPPWAENPP
ncbi:MAG: PKD domain-containing protein [Thermoplasmata archaeon]|nr:PKD domain-containing protein [Thermoplasmata archaeon]